MATEPDSTSTDAPSGPSLNSDGEDEPDETPGREVDLRPPDIKTARTSIGSWLAHRRRMKKRKKYAKKGYVKWKLLGSVDPEPKFIKPESKGGGLPEYEYDGQTYVFPEEARLPDSRTGMWTYYHRKGDAKPVNPVTPVHPTVDPADLKEFLSKRPTVSPPGWLENLDIDPKNALMYLVVGIIVFAMLQRALGG